MLAGWSHRRVALAGYALMLAAAASAFLARPAGDFVQCGIMAVWVAAWTVLARTIERNLRRVGEEGEAVNPRRSID